MKGVVCLGWPVFALLAMFAAPNRAEAGSVACTAGGPTLDFGTVMPNSGYPYTNSGYIAVTCSNTTAATAFITGCVSIGTGSE